MQNLRTETIYGPPGTGKTTSLLDLVEQYLSQGVKPDEIAYLAFTVKAAHEAAERAGKRFGMGQAEFPWFRTIHSLAFSLLGLSTSQVMQRKNYSEICQRLGYEYSGYVDLEEGQTATALFGDRLLFMESLARAKKIPYQQQLEESREDVSQFEFDLFVRTVQLYKESHFMLDFNDMLDRMSELRAPGYKVLIVDEAQDLSNLQWEIIERIMENSENVHIAGDDDQAIFRWAGANPDRFVGQPGTKRVLEQSYRIPERVHRLAERIISRVASRPAKRYNPRRDQGSVSYVAGHEELTLESGDWLVLGRNSYLLKEVQERCLRDNLGYVGKGGKLYVPEDYPPDETPNVRISTIHGAKGAEAENVAIFTDVSRRCYESMETNLDDELRTFYVACTRAKSNLYIIDPKSNDYVEFLHS